MSFAESKAVAVACENLGVKSIENDATHLLVNDAELRVRQIVELAYKFTRRSHRTQLEAKDVKRAMNLLKLEVTPK